MNNFTDFSYSLELDEVTDQAENLAWGNLTVSLNGRKVWFQQDFSADDPAPVHWTWSDLLAYMGKNWPALMYEETYPLNLNPLNPLELRRLAAASWEGMDDAQVDNEDEEIYNFERRHDLASDLNGVYLPSLFIMREGNLAWVCSEGECLRVEFSKVIQTLVILGDEIAEKLQGSTNPRAILALSQWRGKDNYSIENVIEFRSGMTIEDAKSLANGEAANDYWELTDDFRDSEILAAARYSSGVLDLDEQKSVLDTIKTFDYVYTPELDKLSLECVDLIEGLKHEQAFAQGYAAAGWLREKLAITSVFNPELTLEAWGIKTGEIKVTNTLEALAFWGRSHGPAILINTAENALCTKLQSLRTTLAHEICHLLMDRSGSLPFAEAVGGKTPVWVEKRARAFAAELLLPRDLACRAIELRGVAKITVQEFENEIQNLAASYIVSTGLVIHQLRNSRLTPTLPRKIKDYLLRRNQEVSHLVGRVGEF